MTCFTQFSFVSKLVSSIHNLENDVPNQVHSHVTMLHAQLVRHARGVLPHDDVGGSLRLAARVP